MPTSDSKPLPQEDLQAIVDAVGWEPLRGARILLTGGTGFLGSWLVESFILANRQHDLKATMLTVSRKSGYYDDPTVTHSKANICSPRQAGLGAFTHCIHAACPSCAVPPVSDLEMFDTIVTGTRNVLNGCADTGAKRILYISSGAAEHRTETVYGGAKKAAEMLCGIYAEEYGLEIPIARPYALVGPGLPLDGHFAIGKFIHDALAGGPVRVLGGTNVFRSYLYASDVATWLWTILLKGESCVPVDVGSRVAINIRRLAETVAHTLGVAVEAHPPRLDMPGFKNIIIHEGNVPVDTYLPVVDIGFRQTVSLKDAILRTANFAHLS